jgi:hypothetical protein
VLGHKNARPVAPKLGNVLFRGTAKFFAGFAKGHSPWNFVVGPESLRGALTEDQSQMLGGSSVEVGMTE